MKLSTQEVERIAQGWDQDAAKAKSIHKDAYINAHWHDIDRAHIFRKSWQYLCHENQLAKPGDYLAAQLHGQSIFVCRQSDGSLKAHYLSLSCMDV